MKITDYAIDLLALSQNVVIPCGDEEARKFNPEQLTLEEMIQHNTVRNMILRISYLMYKKNLEMNTPEIMSQYETIARYDRGEHISMYDDLN